VKIANGNPSSSSCRTGRADNIGDDGVLDSRDPGVDSSLESLDTDLRSLPFRLNPPKAFVSLLFMAAALTPV
jgi:hypothetical protein